MAKMEPYIYNWYSFLKNGELMGTRCTKCGTYEFPPLPICNECGEREMEWVKMSGHAKMLNAGYAPMGIYPLSDDPKVCIGVQMEEGPMFKSWLTGVKKPGKLAQQLQKTPMPIDVEAEIVALDENISWPAFRIAENQEDSCR